MYEAFVNYASALAKCVTEQMPAVLESAEELPSQAEQAKDAAQGEFEALDIMKKGKALLAVGLNIKVLGKIPGFVKTSINGFKDDLNELKDALNELKATLPQIKTAGATCATNNLITPVECYKLIHGPIKYTQEQRTEWEEKMQERADKKGIWFRPQDYPTTDMIADTAGQA